MDWRQLNAYLLFANVFFDKTDKLFNIAFGSHVSALHLDCQGSPWGIQILYCVRNLSTTKVFDLNIYSICKSVHLKIHKKMYRNNLISKNTDDNFFFQRMNAFHL